MRRGGGGPGRGERVFFALWPADAVRAALARLARARCPHQARPLPAANLHLTLLFLGQVAAPAVDALRSGAGELRLRPFELVLDHTGCFPRSRVFWSAASHTPPALAPLVAALRELAGALHLPVERRALHPHVTLARGLDRFVAPEAHDPVHWPVAAFALVASRTLPQGAVYRVLQCWPADGP